MTQQYYRFGRLADVECDQVSLNWVPLLWTP